MALVEAGSHYLTDEAVVVGPSGQILGGLSRQPQLSETSRSLLHQSRWKSVSHADSSSYVEVTAEERIAHPIEAQPSVVAFLDSTANNGPADAVARLIGDSFEPARKTQEGLERVAALVTRTRQLAIERTSPHKMVSVILNACSSTTSPPRP